MEFHLENRNNEIHRRRVSDPFVMLIMFSWNFILKTEITRFINVRHELKIKCTFSSPVTVQSVYKSRVVCPGVGCCPLEEAEQSRLPPAPPEPPGADTPPSAQCLGVRPCQGPRGGGHLHAAGPVYQADDRAIGCLL